MEIKTSFKRSFAFIFLRDYNILDFKWKINVLILQ